ncbi:MAG: Fe-S cluster assembly protein SufD [Cyclobacteriaceae bacterium]|nr:MAG: Fe-S cluster assembly protein SufD [Cyclobacteriaceae bacterium]
MKTTEQNLRDHFTEQFSDLTQSLNGGQVPEIKQLRSEAIKAFTQKGFPQGKEEEYKYTPITKALLRSEINLQSPAEVSMIPPFNEHLLPELKGHILVFWNGRLVYSSEDFPESLEVQQMDQLGADREDLMVKYFGKISNYKKDAFAALNTALFNHGSLITVKENSKVDLPVIIYHLSDARNGLVYSQTRHLVVVEKNAQVTLVEICKNLTPKQQNFHNTVSEIYLKEQAKLQLNKVQTGCSGMILVDNTDINQLEGSELMCNTITTNGTIVRNNLNITIDGMDCTSHMNGLYLAKGTDHIDNHTLVDHRIANSFSDELYKGIIDDSATGVFNGKIYVQPDAQKTNAFQSNKNILLSDKASMNTKPQLEIWADDVKCSHGATTGQIDAEQVFYLRTRGLDEQQAKGLLLYAFATEFLEHISLPALSDYLEQVIADRLYRKIDE